MSLRFLFKFTNFAIDHPRAIANTIEFVRDAASADVAELAAAVAELAAAVADDAAAVADVAAAVADVEAAVADVAAFVACVVAKVTCSSGSFVDSPIEPSDANLIALLALSVLEAVMSPGKSLARASWNFTVRSILSES